MGHFLMKISEHLKSIIKFHEKAVEVFKISVVHKIMYAASALRVPRAVTRLTVYRSLCIRMRGISEIVM